MEENFCLEVLNNPTVIRNHSDKLRFAAELKKLNDNGQYLVRVKGSDRMKISSKNAATLAQQIAMRDELIEHTFTIIK